VFTLFQVVLAAKLMFAEMLPGDVETSFRIPLPVLILQILVNLPLMVATLQLIHLHFFLARIGMTTYEYIVFKSTPAAAKDQQLSTVYGRRVQAGTRVLPDWMDWFAYKRRRKSRVAPPSSDNACKDLENSPAPADSSHPAKEQETAAPSDSPTLYEKRIAQPGLVLDALAHPPMPNILTPELWMASSPGDASVQKQEFRPQSTGSTMSTTGSLFGTTRTLFAAEDGEDSIRLKSPGCCGRGPPSAICEEPSPSNKSESGNTSLEPTLPPPDAPVWQEEED